MESVLLCIQIVLFRLLNISVYLNTPWSQHVWISGFLLYMLKTPRALTNRNLSGWVDLATYNYVNSLLPSLPTHINCYISSLPPHTHQLLHFLPPSPTHINCYISSLPPPHTSTVTFPLSLPTHINCYVSSLLPPPPPPPSMCMWCGEHEFLTVATQSLPGGMFRWYPPTLPYQKRSVNTSTKLVDIPPSWPPTP